MIAIAMMLQAGASFCLAASLALYVSLSNRKSAPQWTLLGILFGICSWTAGVFIAWAAPESETALALAIPMVYLGSTSVPGLTFYLAALCAQLEIVEEQPIATAAASLVPGSISFLMLLTNPMHGLFLTSTGFDIFRNFASSWAGPIFWIHLVLSYAFVISAMAISAYAAYRAGPNDERRRLTLLAFSSLVPLIANAIYVFRLIPISFPLTYAGLGITGLLLAVAISRYGFIESFVPARDVIAHLRTGIILADVDGRMTSANEAALRMLRRSIDDIQGEYLSDFAETIDPGGTLSGWLATRSTVDATPVTIETPEGSILEIHLGSVRSRSGRIVADFVALDDHTELHRYERFRQRVERLDSISTLVAGLSHELNNPLAFVQANVSHIRRTAESAQDRLGQIDSEWTSDLHDLCEAAEESLVGLRRIQQVVSSTKQLLQDPEVRVETVDLNTIVRDSLSLLGASREDRIAIVPSLCPTPLNIKGSTAQLGQLVLNLLVNARDAVLGQTGATIHIDTRNCNDCDGCSGGVELRVGDNGPGVPPELGDKIFEPFFTTKSVGSGTGLGLAICAEIVRNHDGLIDVSVSNLGGACISVRLSPEGGECLQECSSNQRTMAYSKPGYVA